MNLTRTTPAEYGPAVKLIRKGARVRQRDVATLAGISPSTLSRFEQGKSGVTEPTYFAIQRAIIAATEKRAE